ncbi:MAG TPA: hypothetical protein P5569_12230, partial [Candidatus Latescibacteria bacterium]|nr:hypothetical protein [Candidatus Latescibacterota bacterium]
ALPPASGQRCAGRWLTGSTDLSGWGRNLTQVVHPEKRNVSFRVVEGAIRMTVSKSGTTFILR